VVLTVEPWTAKLIESDQDIAALLGSVHRIAVLGIKTEKQSDQPAFYVPRYAQRAGLEIIPVPVYYPDATEILGQTVYRTLAAIPGGVDMVNVFRRPDDVPAHVEDILACKPHAVWMQLGIRHAATAERLARAGIAVVQDRCLLVELKRVGR
jgi:predicted CoA-binding protein